MSYQTERQEFQAELDDVYATYPSDLAAVEAELHELSAAHAGSLPYTLKAAGYEVMARRCPVRLFRHSPFYHELDVGKLRTDLGAGVRGGWLAGRRAAGREAPALI